uniref:Receptor-type tyrosine-protein phosphatase N2 n=1 Tax=Oreochromis niloticus TaxID=8128 RepID=A0A669BPF0_ORENI
MTQPVLAPSLPLWLLSYDKFLAVMNYLHLLSVYVLTDGMFGRCHSVPVKEIYTYDVSPSVVQRFRMLLEKLSNRGKHVHACSAFLSPNVYVCTEHAHTQSGVLCHPRTQTWSVQLEYLVCFNDNNFCVFHIYFTSISPPERFIENVLKNVDRQHVDVDTLTPQDLDQLSSLIAEALQVVDQDKGLNRGLSRMRGPGPRDLEGELSDGEEEVEEEEEEGEVPRDELLGNAPTLKPQESTPVALAALQGNFTVIHFIQKMSFVKLLNVCMCVFHRVVGPAVTFKVSPNAQNVSTADVANVAVQKKVSLEKEAKVSILEAGIGSQINQIPTKYSQTESTKFLILTVVSILCIVGVLLASTVVYCLRHRSHHKLKEKLTNLGTDTSSDATATYQELCRQRMAVKPPAERPEPISSRINSVSSQFSDGGQAVSPSARSSISSWSEEPAHSNMDISTGHMILSYMEDHLKNKDRLEKEWEALCAYQAEPNACTIGLKDGNAKKNRSTAVVAYDHSRITLKVENSQGNSDYINASPIMDHDPRNPAYIATQGPLPSTVADFWQMVWENGCVVIVMLTPLVESGVKQCYHYWPDEGSNLYHIYEVNLVSEHIWCDDFLVRSFYLKNMQTNETRTVTQFHFLTWLNQNVPETSRTLLDFRRKVNKCYRGRSCPIIVHCSDGAGRTGTYILIDMVLNKMAKGAKEIDIAATLEHLRDQRPGMVQTKDQFEFALTAVAEEVNAILKALPQ